MGWKRGGRAAAVLVVPLLLMPAIVLLGEGDAGDDAKAAALDETPAVGASQGRETGAAQGDSSDHVPAEVVHVDRATAAALDAALMAEQSELSVEEAERAMSFQDAFTCFGMEVLLPRYEDRISAIWTVPAPATRAYVRFVADVPEEVRVEAARRGLDIVFQGGGEISMAQHDLRSDLAADALLRAGYTNLMVHSDRKTSTLNIQLRVPAGAHLPDDAEIVTLVRQRVAAYRAAQGESGLLTGRAAEVRPGDVVFVVTVSSEPMAVAG